MKFTRLLLFLFIAGNAFAEDLEWDISKTDADHVKATFTESDGVLTVSGDGEMIDNWTEREAPWFNVNGVDYKTKITAIIIENGVTNIGNYAFASIVKLLTSIVIGDDVERIGDYAFAYLSSPEIVFGKNVKRIGRCAFWNLHNDVMISLPAGLTTIEDKAFNEAYMTRIVIPASVETIGDNTFYCRKLKTVTVECMQPPALGSSNFPMADVLYVPEEALPLYRSADGWSSFDNRYRTIEGLTGIPAVGDGNPGDRLSPSARYFTLQGQEVSKPAKGVIYIVRNGGKTKKLRLKQ